MIRLLITSILAMGVAASCYASSLSATSGQETASLLALGGGLVGLGLIGRRRIAK